MRVYWNCTLCRLMVKTAMPSCNLPKGWRAGTLYNTRWVLPSSFKHTSVLLFKRLLVPTTGPPSQPCPNLPPQTKRGGNCQGLHKSQDQRAGPLQNEQNKCKPSLNSWQEKNTGSVHICTAYPTTIPLCSPKSHAHLNKTPASRSKDGNPSSTVKIDS